MMVVGIWQRASLALLLLASSVAAQDAVYYFTGAIYVTSGQSPSAAVAASCPADHPVSCTNLQEPYYCCPSNNYCSWNNAQVACCPNGQTCTGSVGGGGGYSPTSWYQTSTWYPQPATTVVTGGGVVVPAGYATTVYTTPNQQTTIVQGAGGYCSTLYAHGGNLPTTAQGECGTILVEEPGEAARHAMSLAKMATLVIAFQMLGGILFLWR